MPHGKIYDNITELVGNTPMVRLHRVPAEGSAELIVKLEAFNPLSSVKDRIALSMIEDAERRGELRPGSTIVEATSGNTGIGLAFVAAAKGYKCALVLPDTMSVERRKLLQALGAELILTPGPAGLPFAIKTAEDYAKKTPGAWLSRQFDNPANPKVHRETTAEEIWRDTGGKLDAVVAGIGTGGTITGTGQIFKQRNKNILTVGVMPVEVQVFKGGPVGPHKIQGIGPTFVPKVFEKDVVDRIFDTTFEQAVETARALAKREGILVGISSGAVAYAALQIAKELGKGKRVVAVLPDTGERYLSTPLFEYTEAVNQPATTPQMYAAQQQAATAAPSAP